MESKLTNKSLYDLQNTNIIPPVKKGIKRPLWSVMIPTFNPKDYIFEALESVLSQYPGKENMQIEIVDDCSDRVDIPKLIGNLGEGKIEYYRLPKNVGHSFNFTEAVRRARGELVLLLHDDDLVKPGFFKKFEEIFKTYPDIGAAYCRQEYIDDEGNYLFLSETDLDETGILEDALIKLAERQRIQYCAMVVKRSTYETTGGFIRKNIGCEDWEMWVRIASKFKIAYLPEVFAQYRIHRTSMTLNDMRTGQDMRFLMEAVNIFNKYLPEDKRKEVKKYTREYYSGYSFRNAMMLLNDQNDEKGAAEQISETINLNSGLVHNNLSTLYNFSTPVKGAGVSVLIFTNNSEDLILNTLRNLVKQKVPVYIPWEIIIADSGSSDNTLNIAEKFLNLHLKEVKYRIINFSGDNVFQNRNAAIENAEYNFIIFCFPGIMLNEHYVKNASENMMTEMDLGVLGGYSEYESNVTPPKWFEEWKSNIYKIGEQYEYSSEVTWSRGYVWEEGMVIRKEAWRLLLKNNFTPYISFPGKKQRDYSFDKELCYAMRLNEWRIWYSVELKLSKFLKEKDLSWDELRINWHKLGRDSVLLSEYLKSEKREIDDLSKLPYRKTDRKLIFETGRKLKFFSWKKLESYPNKNQDDQEMLMIEFHLGRLRELLKNLGSYNKKLRALKRVFRKGDFKFLKFIIENPYFRYPQYENKIDNRGVSIIVNYKTAENGYLLKCLENISVQKLPKGFKWEVIVNGPDLPTGIRNKAYAIWSTSKCTAQLILNKEKNIKPFIQKKSGLSKSRFECIIYLNEYNFINNDYVRVAYKIINSKKHIGLLGGSAEVESGVRLPGWFNKHKELFGIGIKYPSYGNLTYTKESLWDQGLVIRRSALQKILKTDYYLKDDSFADLRNMNYEGKVLTNQIKSSGWEVWYEPRLKLKKFITVSHFKWESLREIHFTLGSEHTRDELNYLYKRIDKIRGSNESINWIYKANSVLGKINRYPVRKIFSGKDEYRGNTDILEIEELKGKFSEIIKNRSKYNKLLELATSSNGNGNPAFRLKKNTVNVSDTGNFGVSIVICCYNSSKVLEKTLQSIINQKVPDIIPWEVVLVDNASTDNTSETARKYWENHNCLAPLIIVKESEPGLSAARKKGFETSRYEFIILCDDDNRLEENFVARVYEIMNKENSIGVLGGQGNAEFEEQPKSWFYDWKDSFAIGKQTAKSGDITWTKGYVWGAAMTIRKTAWNYLLQGGFKSKLTDRKGNSLSAGGDTELCYALRNQDWKIWYDTGLKYTHYITSDRLNWKYIRRLFRGFGKASACLDKYLKIPGLERRTTKKISVPGSVRTELRKTITILRKTRYKKLLSYYRRREGDTDIPMIEYCLGRIESLLKTRNTYNRGLHLLKKSVKKRDLKFLKIPLRNIRKVYPRYNVSKKFNGVSVIVCTFNGEDRLPDTIRHIAKQKVDSSILWEVILVDNASTDNTKNAVIQEWHKHKCKARLKIVDEYTQGLSAARQKGFDVSSYEYIVLCDDDNWLDENFVQHTFEIMSSNYKIGVLGGPNDPLCETEPPEWFKYFQKGFATGEQADIHTEKITEGDITYKRGFVWGAGMVLRKTAMKNLYASGFKSIMSDRKGYHLSSGGDSELCFALVLSGWKVWYDDRLKLIHCMPSGRLVWNYLIRLFAGFGITSVGLDLYEKAIKLGRSDFTEEEVLRENWKYEFRKTFKDLRKYGIRKLLSLRHPQDNNTKVPMMEYYIARLTELWRVRKEYDGNFEILRNAKWKLSNKDLKQNFRNFIETENDFRYGWPWSDTGKHTAHGTYNEIDFPKISILSPSFNSKNTIEKAILSVLNQGYPNFEHIICDGGSKDGTLEIIRKYPHVKWISEPDKGQCDAMNKAFNISNGDIISYLNVDDYYQRGAFHKIAKAFKENPDAGMIVGNLFFEYDYHTFIRKPETEYEKIMLPFKYIFPINPVCYFYKRIVQVDAGPFPLDNHYTMDYWFLLKAYQNFKISKIEDYLGTFWMNGLNKTSGADNRKNTHYRVIEHCWNHDRKKLPKYLFSYYKHYYYDVKPYSLKKIGNKIKKNSRRLISVLTFKKNKYYNDKLYQKARSEYYLQKRFKAAGILMASYLIYPKAIKKKSRLSLLSYSVFGINKTEKMKWFYFFLTTPAGLPLANKLHYYANEFKKKNKKTKSYSLFALTYIVSPNFKYKTKRKKSGVKTSRSRLRYLNPLNWARGFINFFRYKKYKSISYDFYLKAGEKYFHHKNIKSVIYLISGFIVYPLSISKRSRMNLFLYSALGNTISEKIKFMYHLYKDNPEYSFAHKLDYYGNELRKEGRSFKGNSILMFAYILNPKYIAKRTKVQRSKIIYASDFKLPKKSVSLNPIVHIKKTEHLIRNLRYSDMDLGTKMRNFGAISRYKMVQVYDYFRYRKFKAKSKELYSLAQKSYSENNRVGTIKYIIPSFLLYPVSIFKRNKIGMLVKSIIGNSAMDRNSKKENEKQK